MTDDKQNQEWILGTTLTKIDISSIIYISRSFTDWTWQTNSNINVQIKRHSSMPSYATTTKICCQKYCNQPIAIIGIINLFTTTVDLHMQ